MVKISQGGSSLGQQTAKFVVKLDSQRSGKTRAAIVGCTAAQTDDQSAAAFIEGSCNQLACAECGGQHRIAVVFCQQSQSGSGRQFYNAGAVRQYSKDRIDRFTERTPDQFMMQDAGQTFTQSKTGTLTAIGNGDDRYPGSPIYFCDSPSNGARRFNRAAAAFKRVNGCDDMQCNSPCRLLVESGNIAA